MKTKLLSLSWIILLSLVAAGQRISELPALTGIAAANDDVLPIVDTSAGAAGSKKITLAELFATPAADLKADADAGNVTAATWRTALDVPAVADLPFVDIRAVGAVAGTGVTEGVRTANTAAIQAAIDSGNPIYIPAGRWEINSALVWDIDQGIMFGEGSRASVIHQSNAAAHGITFTTSPEATGVTKMGIIERLRLDGVGAGTATGYGFNADKADTPSHAWIRGRDLYIRGFARGVHLRKFDNIGFIGCEFNTNAINVYAEGQTRTVTFLNCVNSTATGVSWRVAAGGNVALWGCDTGSGSQHALVDGAFIARDSNFEAVNGSGSPNGHIEGQTIGTIVLDNVTMLGGTSTLPAVYYIFGQFGNIFTSGFGAGGGKIRKASASSIGHFYGLAGLTGNRQVATTIADNAGQFEMLPFGTFDMARTDVVTPGNAANRGLLQYLAGISTNADRIKAKIYDGASHQSALVGLIEFKTTTGDPTTGHEGRMVVNTFDNTMKVYADGGWRTIASGW